MWEPAIIENNCKISYNALMSSVNALKRDSISLSKYKIQDLTTVMTPVTEFAHIFIGSPWRDDDQLVQIRLPSPGSIATSGLQPVESLGIVL